ncbi:HEAT repeat domain-containing protein [Collimonas fungivorans]|uniref:HEAT repeat domain-containing protein n=1 Tax=Collimonas fungivorans TaxID=158899 RepID=UPI0007787035|nr:HEAT repeat domain-containing protein [Collimonas fungivorans]
MRHELVDLIERMTVREKIINSGDSISWHAYREAERLDDKSMVDELDEYLAQKPTKDQRSAAYFIIGKIAKNCASLECASRLIAYSSREKDKYALANLLDGLAEIPKPESLEIEPLFSLLQDSRWLVRHAAIRSLQGCASSEAEDKLLEVLANTSDPDDAVYCHSTLGRIGSYKALPALAQGLKSRKRDVKISAQAAITAIEVRNDRLTEEAIVVQL